MLSIEQGKKAINFARSVLSSTVKNKGSPKDNLPPISLHGKHSREKENE